MKRQFIVELEGCDHIRVGVLKEYIKDAIDIQRGAGHPDDSLMDFKVVRVKSFYPAIAPNTK